RSRRRGPPAPRSRRRRRCAAGGGAGGRSWCPLRATGLRRLEAAVGAGVESGTALTVLAPHRAEVLARARVDEHTVDRLDPPLRRATGGAHDPLLLGVRLARREDLSCPGPRVDLLVLVGLHGTGAGRGARPVAVQLAGWGRVPH